jgi:hypothetical protein
VNELGKAPELLMDRLWIALSTVVRPRFSKSAAVTIVSGEIVSASL